MSDDLMGAINEILLPKCKCGSRYCGPYRCRFDDPDGLVIVRGVKFRDEDDAYEASVQRQVDGE